VSSTWHGSNIDHETGNLTTARGSSAAVTTATAFQTIDTPATLAQIMGSSSSASRTWLLADFHGFQYSGYWFSLVDPWPEYWASNWYETDDVYVVYENNGYYMYNRRYPGFGMAISVSL
jgi:hypothetical protein